MLRSKFIKHHHLLPFLFGWCPLLFVITNTNAQNSFKGLEHLFKEPLHYTAAYTNTPPVIDGDLNEAIWTNVTWSELFTDIEGEKQKAPTFKTKFKMRWDKDFLYIAADIKEPHIWANLNKHDEVVFNDNDFEVFIDPDNNTHQYFEIEFNAVNTVFDLFMTRPYRNHSDPLISWDTPGMRSAVKVFGTLNDASDIDKGWTVEMAIPYAALTVANVPKIPVNGDLWRINFSRVEWDTEIVKGKYVKKKNTAGKNLPEHNWVWSPQGVVDMHYPERWGYLQFSSETENSRIKPFELPYAEKQKAYLWLVYYRQKEFIGKIGRYAATLKELGIPEKFMLQGINNSMEMDAGKHQFEVNLTDDEQHVLYINQDGLVQNSDR